MTIIILLIFHGLAALFLLGAVTHQTISLWQRRRAPAVNFLSRVANVHGAAYTNAIIILYLLVVIGGGVIYPTYVLDVKGSLTDARMLSAIGAFEIKEHLAVIGLALLPTYGYFWRKAAGEHITARRMNTLVLCLIVWWNFLIGHILNNIKGLL